MRFAVVALAATAVAALLLALLALGACGRQVRGCCDLSPMPAGGCPVDQNALEVGLGPAKRWMCTTCDYRFLEEASSQMGQSGPILVCVE